MSSKYDKVEQLYRQLVPRLSRPEYWDKMLRQIAPFWKLANFTEGMLLTEQLPNATAVASFEQWKKAALARLYLRSDKPSRHYQAEIVLNQLIKQATGEQKSYFESVLGAAYYYSDTLRDTAKAKELLERAAQNGSEYAAVLLSRIAGHERNAVDSLLCSLMALLNSAEHYSNAELKNASKLLFGRGDLSKEMIAELIYKRQDKENTSQR